jgi:hypothetical protein
MDEQSPCGPNQPIQPGRLVCGAFKRGEPPCQNPVDGCPLHCGAKLRNSRNGSPFCPSTPVRGCRRCRMHGASSPRGIASKSFRGKGYSKVLPVEVAKLYRAAADDPELLSLNGEVALIQARLIELAGRLGTGEAGSLWRRLREQYAELSAGMEQADTAKIGAAYAALGEIIRDAAGVEASWEELIALVERKAGVVAREHRRQVDLRQMLSAEGAMALVTGLMMAVKRHVSNPQELRAIAGEVEILLDGGRGSRRVEAEPAEVLDPTA